MTIPAFPTTAIADSFARTMEVIYRGLSTLQERGGPHSALLIAVYALLTAKVRAFRAILAQAAAGTLPAPRRFLGRGPRCRNRAGRRRRPLSGNIGGCGG